MQWVVWVLVLLLAGPVWASNETSTDSVKLLRERLGTVMTGSYMLAGCLPTVPVSSTTLAAVACQGVVYAGGNSVPVTQAAATIGPLTGGDGVYWLALHTDTTTTVGGWTRQRGTHYLWSKADTLPTLTNSAVLAKVAISGAVIFMVEDWRAPSSLVRDGTYSVTDPLYGGVADDSTDVGPALQAAINAAGHQQGRIVRIPQGRYKLNTGVIASYAVEVRGDGWSPQIPSFFVPPVFHWDHQGGTWLHISNAAITPISIIASGVTVRDLAFHHDQPTPGVGWAPTAYPSTIGITNGLGLPVSDINIENLFFWNATRGITYASSHGVSAGRINIRGIWGQFFQSGIYLDYITDSTRIFDVHMWPYWSQDPNVFLYQANNLSSLTILRCDGCYVYNFFSFHSHFGVYFAEGPNGGINGFEGHNLLFDGAVVGIFHEQSTGGSAFIVNFATNGSFTGLTPTPGFESSTGIFFNGVGAYFNFVNFDAVALGASCGSLTNGPNTVTLTNVRCINYNLSNTASPGFAAGGSSTLAFYGYQQITTPVTAPKYIGNLTSALFPGGAGFNLDGSFGASMVGGVFPTVTFASGSVLSFNPSTNLYTLSGSGGTYSTGGVKKYLCIQDGELTVGTTCP